MKIKNQKNFQPFIFSLFATALAPLAIAAESKSAAPAAGPSATVSTSPKAEKKNLFHAGLGYVVPTKITDVDKPTKYRGYEAELGRKFEIAEQLNTTSALYLNAISGKYDLGGGDSATDTLVGLGLRQSFGYDIEFSSTNMLTPAIHLGIARGAEQIRGKVLGYDVEGTVGYYQYLAGVGFRHQISRFAWGMRYDLSRMNYDKTMKMTIKKDGKSETLSGDIDNRKGRFDSVTLSASLLF